MFGKQKTKIPVFDQQEPADYAVWHLVFRLWEWPQASGLLRMLWYPSNWQHSICIIDQNNLIFPITSHIPANLPLILLYHASVRHLSQSLYTQPVHKQQLQSKSTLTVPRFITKCISVDYTSYWAKFAMLSRAVHNCLSGNSFLL